jgi:hypothetical protein
VEHKDLALALGAVVLHSGLYSAGAGSDKMEVHLMSANFTRGGQEYTLSCLFLVSPAKKKAGPGKSLANKVKDVTCMVNVRRKGEAGPVQLCFN